MATEIIPTIMGEALSNGIRRFHIALNGCVGLSSAASETVANYAQNPLYEDLVILNSYMVIYEEDAQDADFDIGIADDAIATNPQDDIFDSPVNTAEAVLYGTVQGAVNGSVAKPIWRAKGSSTDSYITTQQNGNVDAADLRYNLVLEVVYLKDLATGKSVA